MRNKPRPSEIQEEILQFFSDYYGCTLHPDEEISSKLTLDSVRIVEVLAFLELKFGITIDARKISRKSFQTVASISKAALS